MTTSDLEQAAFELDAAADLIFPFIARIDGVIELMDSNGGLLPNFVPPELRVPLADIWNVVSSGQRAFFRHLSIYPKLQDEWIWVTDQQIRLTFVKGIREVLAEKVVVLRKCAAIARGKAGLPMAKELLPNHYYIGGIHVAGDIKKSVGQGFIQEGDHAKAYDMTFQQVWNQSSAPEIDLAALVNELATLRQALKGAAKTAEHDAAIGEVAMAETAAKKGDGPSVMQRLKSAGQWVLDIAIEKGLTMAVTALKSALGL